LTNSHRVLFALVALLAVVSSAFASTIETVPVGNPGNAPPQNSGYNFGSVEYDYRIAKYEVTNTEYVEFLNGVDPTGTNRLALYHANMSSDARGGITFNSGAANGSKYQFKAGRERNPVVFVSWYDAIRFTNWLHNGQGSGNTENGAYTLLGNSPTPSNAASVTRNPGAKWWLPSFDELSKATYHKNDGVTANYWDYPFASNSIPNSDQPPGSDAPIPANTANFNRNDSLANEYNDGYAVTGSTSLSGMQNYLTNVGAYALSQSPYGTFDQGGNVWEWSDAGSGFSAGTFGGSWNSGPEALRATSDVPFLRSSNQLSNVGFRVAAMPEPNVAGNNINIAVDFDSSVGLSAIGVGGSIATQPGFLSWNANWAFNYPASGPLTADLKTQFFAQGVEFGLQAFRPGPSGLETPNFLGSRDRPTFQGQPDDLLRDFVFAEGAEGTFLHLTMSGLPAGTYRMTTWHYDSFFGSTAPAATMQIEVGDKQAGAIAAATTVVVDNFPLGTSPQVFEFQVDSSNSVKEIVFRSDNQFHRARLNGFALVRIPEPCTCLLLLAGVPLLSPCHRNRVTHDDCEYASSIRDS
jgi:hypothetical protein